MTSNLNAQTRNDGEKFVTLDKLTKVYPNPVSEGAEINIVYDVSTKTEVGFYILDALGNLIIEQAVIFTPEANSFTLNTIDLKKGVYLMKVLNKNTNNLEIRKVVVR